MDIVSMAIQGNTTKLAAMNLVEGLVSVLGMSPAHESICYDYPVNNAGGKGFTFIAPITESFIAFDAWPDFNGAYLVICSCKTISLNKVNKKVRAHGYEIMDNNAHELSL